MVPPHWRSQRRLGVTELDPSLWFVDFASAATLNHLRFELAPLATTLGLTEIDLSTITSQQRRFTQEAARYVYEQTDDRNEPLYAGIRYVSRLSAGWECWAIFHGRLIHFPHPQQSIFPNDPGLVEAATVLGLVLSEEI